MTRMATGIRAPSIPVVAYFDGDFIYSVLVVRCDELIGDFAARYRRAVVGRRIPIRCTPLQIDFGGRLLDLSKTVNEENIAAMDQLTISYVGTGPSSAG